MNHGFAWACFWFFSQFVVGAFAYYSGRRDERAHFLRWLRRVEPSFAQKRLEWLAGGGK